MTWTEERIQLALTSHVKAKFYARRWTCVPNITDWGLPTVVQPNREIDLICVPASRWVHAVEIKISKSDLISGAKKRWRLFESRNKIRYEWFAVPKELGAVAMFYAPPTAGVNTISEREGFHWSLCEVLREPTTNIGATKLNDAEFLLLLRLGVMRMWSRRNL